MAAASSSLSGTDPEDMKAFTYDILKETYEVEYNNPISVIGSVFQNNKNNSSTTHSTPTPTQREVGIPVQTLSEGALLYHYLEIPKRDIDLDEDGYVNYEEPNDEYEYRVLETLLRQLGINITWKRAYGYSENSKWELCLSKNIPTYNYFYTNPSAGFGVNGFGGRYNVAYICKTTRDSRWAYLKSGTHLANDQIHHRSSKIQVQKDYDSKRLVHCSAISNTCRSGAGYDICMTPEFQQEHRVDGITSIAEMDSMFTLERDPRINMYQINTESRDRPMLQALKKWFQDIQRAGNEPIDKMMWSMNLLSLETDIRKENTELVAGFREFACPTFGSLETDLTLKTKEEIVAELEAEEVPLVRNELEGYKSQGPKSKKKGAKKQEQKPKENTYSLSGLHGSLYGFYDQPVNKPPKIWFADTLSLAYFLKKYIYPRMLVRPMALVSDQAVLGRENYGTYLERNIPRYENILRYNLNHQIGLWLTKRTIGYNLLQNVFYDSPEARPELRIGGQFINRHNYTYPLSLKNYRGVEIVKILHECISNSQWKHNWMSVVEFQMPGSTQSKMIPVGPFYNALSIPIDNYGDMVKVYQFIVNQMENVVGPSEHSNTYSLLNSPAHAKYILDWALNPAPKIVARWLEDLRTKTPLLPQLVPTNQRGGKVMPPLASEFLTSGSSNVFRKNLATNLKPRNRKKNTERNRNTKTIFVKRSGKKNMTRKNRIHPSNKSGQKSGSSSTNITPFTADMAAAIKSIRSKPHLRELFDGIFVD
jgi:hypothetical protein